MICEFDALEIKVIHSCGWCILYHVTNKDDVCTDVCLQFGKLYFTAYSFINTLSVIYSVQLAYKYIKTRQGLNPLAIGRLGLTLAYCGK